MVNVSSVAHERGSIDFEDLQGERALLDVEGVRGSRSWPTCSSRGSWPGASAGRGITANALHPGAVATGFGRNHPGFFGRLVAIGAPFLASPEKGARTTLHVATAPELRGVTGRYFSDCREKAPSRAARDDDAALRLWQISEAMTQPVHEAPHPMKILSLALALLAAQAPAPASTAAPDRHPRHGRGPRPPQPPAGRRPAGPGAASGSGPSSSSRPGRPGSSTSRRAGSQVLVATRFGQTMQLHVVDRAMGARTQNHLRPRAGDAGRLPARRPDGRLLPPGRGRVGELAGLPARPAHRPDRAHHRREEPARGAGPLAGRPHAWPTTAPAATARTPTSTWPRRRGPARPGASSSRSRGHLAAASTSPADGRQLLVRRYRSIADSDLFLVDVAERGPARAHADPGKASVGAARFSADGKSVYLVTDRQGDFDELYRLDLADASAAPRPLTRNLRWDVEGLAVARDGVAVSH